MQGKDGETIEEPDDETLEKEYEELAQSSNIHISFEKGASRIGRGKSHLRGEGKRRAGGRAGLHQLAPERHRPDRHQRQGQRRRFRVSVGEGRDRPKPCGWSSPSRWATSPSAEASV